ncbi:MAG: helix-turn-helix protein [Acidobacteriota bacterium]|nr:helix-turn-helix protein [Acidobacteriota bacterium]
MDEKILKNALGKRFAEVRKAKRLTQVEFSKQLGVSSATVANIERGFIYPNMDLLYYLIFKEGVSPYWLFSGDGEMVDTQRIVSKIYHVIQDLIEDPEVETLLLDLNIPAMRHFLLAHHQMLAESPEFKNQKEKFQLLVEAK